MPHQPPTDFPTTRTPEQHALVRRRAFPVALAGILLGALALALTLIRPVNASQPPSLMAANLAFCAMLIGAAMLFYARGTPGTRPAAAASIASLLLGMTATFLFTAQAVHSRQARENLELANLRAIAIAANEYAATHQGSYPASLAVLIRNRLIPPQTLQSPYGRRSPLLSGNTFLEKDYTPENYITTVDAASDYLFLAGDLKDVPKELAPALLVAVNKNAVMRIEVSVAFADNTSRFVPRSESGNLVIQCDAARAKLDLRAQNEVPIFQSALDDQKGK